MILSNQAAALNRNTVMVSRCFLPSSSSDGVRSVVLNSHSYCRRRRWLSSTSVPLASPFPRRPLPPMPRVMPSQQQAPLASNVTTRSWRRLKNEWWDSGRILLTLGWGGLAVLVLDRYLQRQQRTQRREAVQMVKTMEEEIARDKRQLHWRWRGAPVLFHCVIRRAYKPMSGSHGLRGVEVGDVVEILQEGVGPDKAYNLCRMRGKKGSGAGVGEEEGDDFQIGWFPIPFMEKVAPPPQNNKPSLWRRILRRD